LERQQAGRATEPGLLETGTNAPVNQSISGTAPMGIDVGAVFLTLARELKGPPRFPPKKFGDRIARGAHKAVVVFVRTMHV
jgi:hypothetical protein